MMDLIKEEGEIIPDSVLDTILKVSQRHYIELGDECTNEDTPNLKDSLYELVDEIYKHEEGYSVILLTGIFLGQCIMPTIKLHSPNNKLPFVILSLVSGYNFNYIGSNNEYARDKILFPPLKKELREALFVKENNIESLLSLNNTPSYYINSMKFYYYLLGLCINEDIVEVASELLWLCIGENALSDELVTRKQILYWIVIENVCTIWKGRLPSNAFDKDNLWHSTSTKLF